LLQDISIIAELRCVSGSPLLILSQTVGRLWEAPAVSMLLRQASCQRFYTSTIKTPCQVVVLFPTAHPSSLGEAFDISAVIS